ncbi:glycosyltransferase [Paraburkholderia sp. RL17-337-BIB-A]|uniref:glycosyltransferase n=1 Tax=Paraburkholderia sp. RL17-337-BIB-A TaxID=3031636 RepID=UPI0038B8E341
MSANAAQAAIDAHGADSALVVFTDDEEKEVNNDFAVGVHTRCLSNFGEALTATERASIVEKLILAVRPKSVLNIDSVACWDSIVRKGGALQLGTDLYAYLYRGDGDADGHVNDFANTHFRESLPFLRMVYFDTLHFLESLASEHGIPPSLRGRLVPLYQPARVTPTVAYDSGATNRDAVIWAGRADSKTSVDLLLKIAVQAPDLTFDVFTNEAARDTKHLQDAVSSSLNLRLRGSFSSVSRLPLADYGAFLCTSISDGLSLELIEVASTGMAVVAPAIGDLAELVTSTTGWPVASYHEPEPYVQALRQIKDDSQLAISKSRCMVEHVRARHSWTAFTNVLRASPTFID